MKFVKRSDWNARPPRNRTKLDGTGSVVHWNGPTIWRGVIGDHSRCAGLVRGIQNFHMDGRKWSDVAYSCLVCPHGAVFEGRWKDTRTAANGTNDCNNKYYAVMYLGGEGDPLTGPGKQALREAVDALSNRRIQPHSDCKATSCPGDDLRNWVAQGSPNPQPQPEPPGGEMTNSSGVRDWLIGEERTLLVRLEPPPTRGEIFISLPNNNKLICEYQKANGHVLLKHEVEFGNASHVNKDTHLVAEFHSVRLTVYEPVMASGYWRETY